jgi:hypothetical protein
MPDEESSHPFYRIQNWRPMSDPIEATLPLKQFLQIEHCPMEWRRLNLYIIRDEEVVFYVGQSYTAFNRVWEHFYDGFKGRSLVGRFIVCNWPASMHFTIELLSSKIARFACLENDLNRSEQLLIEQYTPCLNTVLNPHPAPLPDRYSSPYTSLKFFHHPKKFIRQAAQVIQAEQRRAWLAQSEESGIP